MKKYINFEGALRVVDDLDFLDIGMISRSKLRPTSSLARTKSSTEKRSTNQARDAQEKPRFDSRPLFTLRTQLLPHKYETYMPLVEKRYNILIETRDKNLVK